MKIAIAGSTGLIGSSLSSYLQKLGHEIVPILHQGNQLILTKEHEYVDAVINLSGVKIMQRWTSSFKKEAFDSRVGTSYAINHFYDQVAKKPKVFISASAIGYYGDQGGTTLIESSNKGVGFLSDLVEAWEKASFDSPISRVVCFRLGVVLSNKGGMLPKLIKMIKRRLGALMGDPESYLSWIHIDDVIKAFVAAINQSCYHGIYNLVAEESITQKFFLDSLAKILKRKIFLKLPRFVVTLIFGEAAEVILNDMKVFPKKLKQNGFAFDYPDLNSALCSLMLSEP